MPILSPFISIIGDCTDYSCKEGSCAEGAPRSNFDLQVLEGMSLERVIDTTKPEYKNAIEQMRAKEALAIKLVEREVKARLRKTFEFIDVIGSEVTGKFTRDDFVVLNELIGVEIRNVSCDPYTKVKLDWVELKAKAPFDLDLIIVQGCTTTTKCVNLQCGVNRIELNLEDSDRIAVFAEICGDELAKLSWCGVGDDYTCEADKYCGCDCLHIRGVTDTDPDGDPAIDPLEEFEPATLYFRVCAQCVADVPAFFCKHWEELELPILYRWGILLMLEMLHSNSIAPVVRNSKDSAGQLLAQWYGGTDSVSLMEKKGDYWNLIDQSVTYFENAIKATGTKIVKCSGTRIMFDLPA